VLVVSLALHLVVGAALGRMRPPSLVRRGVVELTLLPAPPSPRVTESLPMEPRPMEPRTHEAAPRLRRVRVAAIAPDVGLRPSRPIADLLTNTPPQAQTAAPPEAPQPAPHVVDLFAPSALARVAAVDRAPAAAAPADRAWRPRRGVGGDGGAGGVDVASFLAEDAARQRVVKGAVAPALRQLERRLDDAFVPTFAQADVSNRAELFLKQMRGFWRNPPKTGELQRGLDPTKETYGEKLRSMHPEQAFFLGRRVEVFVRQKPDGTIVEMAVRNASGYRAFDEAALDAVAKALGGRLPAGARAETEVRTLWQLEATAYVVVSPNPELVFDESTGKHEWVYPLQKRVDHQVRLIAVY
jgi:outer membrane biosynthesis protein TonB